MPNDQWQKLFRILRLDEGTGLSGVQSRNISSKLPKEKLPHRTIAQHVADNPKLTPYISMSKDLKKQLEMIEQNLVEFGKSAVYMIEIDAEILKRQGSEVTDLSNSEVRNLYLDNNLKASNYARAWSEVIIRDRIPTEAVIESSQFYYNVVSNRIERKTTRNPRYASFETCTTGQSLWQCMHM